MLLQARRELSGGKSVVLDATFGKRQHRETFRCLGEENGANVIFVECRCPYSVLRKRLAKRRGRKLVSDARLQHLEAQRQRHEPLSELVAANHLKVETDQPLQQSLQEVFSTAYVLLGEQSGKSLSCNGRNDAKI
jgi:predicted kinase